MSEHRKIPGELLAYSPGKETMEADAYPDEIIDKIESLDARIDDCIREKMGLEAELDEESEKKLRQSIIEYINSMKCNMTLSYALRRYICDTFGRYDEKEDKYFFELENENGETAVVCVGNYAGEGYEPSKDDLNNYVLIWKAVCKKYNTCDDSKYDLSFSTAEIKRHLSKTDVCKRDTMFKISFALHMDNNITAQFLTNVLAERSYNYRLPEEIIYHFCQSHPEYNSYCTAMKYIEKYETMSTVPVSGTADDGYSASATAAMDTAMSTPEQLFDFLMNFRPNFDGISRTVYKNFMALYGQALACAQAFNADSEHPVDNPESLAKEIYDCIPRTYRNGSAEGDFVKVNANSTSLYHEVLNSSLLCDRMRKIIDGKSAAQKKDIVILYFYIFCRNTEQKKKNCVYDFEVFRSELNITLMECGMSGLYALNRFDNLVMMSFWSVNPYEFFGEIINESFGDNV